MEEKSSDSGKKNNVSQENCQQDSTLIIPEILFKGECGETKDDQVRYTVDANGEMIIFGDGNIHSVIILADGHLEDYWGQLRHFVKKIVIKDRVSGLGGHYTFAGFANLTSVVIAGPVKIIPTGCFIGCTNLTKVTVRDSLEKIGAEAFKDCEKLETMRFPEELKEIGDNAFNGCVSLQNIYEGIFSYNPRASISRLGSGCFSKTKIIEMKLLCDHKSRITSNTFKGCDNLQKIYLEGAVSREVLAGLSKLDKRITIYYRKSILQEIWDRINPGTTWARYDFGKNFIANKWDDFLF